MSGIDNDHVDFAANQFLSTFEKVASGADGRADAQTSLFVFRRVRVLQFFLNVFDGNQAFEVVVVIDNQQFFDPMAVEDFLGLFEGCAYGNGDEVFFRHHFRNRQIEARFEAQVAIGEDADQLALAGDRDARDAVMLHELERVRDFFAGPDGDGVDNHAAFTAFDAVDLFCLTIDRHIAMHEANAALLGKRNGEVRFGYGVHRGADDGDVERNSTGESGFCLRFGGENFATCGNEEHIIEGETFGDRVRNHALVMPL